MDGMGAIRGRVPSHWFVTSLRLALRPMEMIVDAKERGVLTLLFRGVEVRL
jgi:hypothetical protein